MVEILKADLTLKVKLIGHMDATEMERTRVRPDLLVLGKERAEVLRDALVESGIDTTRIIVESKAGDTPVDDEQEPPRGG